MNPSALVLVAVLNNKRDFEIARVLGWYRIPLRRAPKTVAVDWLAFYQTARFGAEKWAIHYVAPVRGHELTTRAELLRNQPDHPRAQELYYKIQLGPLERLAQPIPSRKWRRLTFVYTTGERLRAAREINDLLVESDERGRLWQALRERGLAAECQYAARPGTEVDLALLCRQGNLAILFGEAPRQLKQPDWHYLVLADDEVKKDAATLVDQIEARVQALGGLAAD